MQVPSRHLVAPRMSPSIQLHGIPGWRRASGQQQGNWYDVETSADDDGGLSDAETPLGGDPRQSKELVPERHLANARFSPSQASASVVDGQSRHTNAIGNPRAIPAWYWSTDESTRRILPTSRTSWRVRMLPCVRSWSAEVSLSTTACWPVMESSRVYRRTRPTGSTGRAAVIRPQHLATPTRTMDVAADLAITLLEAPLRPTSERPVRSQ